MCNKIHYLSVLRRNWTTVIPLCQYLTFNYRIYLMFLGFGAYLLPINESNLCHMDLYPFKFRSFGSVK